MSKVSYMVCAHAVVIILCIGFCTAANATDNATEDSSLGVDISLHSHAKELGEEEIMENATHRQKQSRVVAACGSTLQQFREHLQLCASQGLESSCRLLASELPHCEDKCAALAPDLGKLSLIELSGPAVSFLRSFANQANQQPCLKYSVAMVSVLKEEIAKFVSRDGNGTISTSCPELKAVWNFHSPFVILQFPEFDWLNLQLDTKIGLFADGESPGSFVSRCKSIEVLSVEVLPDRMQIPDAPVQKRVRAAFDSYFSCKDLDANDQETLPQTVPLGEERHFKCNEIPQPKFRRPESQFSRGTTDITCIWEKRENRPRPGDDFSDLTRGVKADFSPPCEAGPPGTRGLSTGAIPECCPNGVSKSGECAQSMASKSRKQVNKFLDRFLK